MNAWKSYLFDYIGANPLLTAAVRTVYGCEPEQLNALFGLAYAQAGGGFYEININRSWLCPRKENKSKK